MERRKDQRVDHHVHKKWNRSRDTMPWGNYFVEFEKANSEEEHRIGYQSTRPLRAQKRVRERASRTSTHCTKLSFLIDKHVVLPRQKVRYCTSKGTFSAVRGKVSRKGIICNCCRKVFSLSDFESHADSRGTVIGCSNRTPGANIFLEDGRSILDCYRELFRAKMKGKCRTCRPQLLSEKMKGSCRRCKSQPYGRIKSNFPPDKSDCFCTVCRDGGQGASLVISGTADNFESNGSSGDNVSLTWKIENFSSLMCIKKKSDMFFTGQLRWQIILYPKGTESIDDLLVSFDVEGGSELPLGWSRHAQLSTTLVNQLHLSKSITRETKHVLNRRGSEFGFTSLIPLNVLHAPSEGYLVNDTCIIETKITVCKARIQNSPVMNSEDVPYPSSAATRKTGFKNVNALKDATTSMEVSDTSSDPTLNMEPMEVPDISSPTPKAASSCHVTTLRPAQVVEISDTGTDHSLDKEFDGASSTSPSDLMNFRGLADIEKDFVPLLKQVCLKYHSLIDCHRERSSQFTWAFTALGEVLHFLKTKRVRDMTTHVCKDLQKSWNELKVFGFNLKWLEPHVERALGMTKLVEGAEELNRLAENVKALEIELKRVEANLAAARSDPVMAEQGSKSHSAEEDCRLVPNPTQQDGMCKLAVDDINNIVAFGMVFDGDSMSTMIHGVPMKEGCVRVAVIGVEKGDALLPVPVEGEMEYVHQAVGSLVAWPKEFVIRTQPFKETEKRKKEKTPFELIKRHPLVPEKCNLLYKHAKVSMAQTRKAISEELGFEVFGHEAARGLTLLADDITQLLEFQWIGSGVIKAYMAYLYGLVEQKQESDVYAFTDPGATFAPEKGQVYGYLLNRLREGNSKRIYFIPHNSGAHWVLTIIREGEIYLLDPLKRSLARYYKKWESTVLSVVKDLNAERGKLCKGLKMIPLKGCPTQPGGVECGYYVMRYMRDIINDETFSFDTKWAACKRTSYTQAEIDEVRIECSDYIQRMI